AVVLMAIGSRAGIAVDAIAFPGHFLVCVEGVYVDPDSGGFPLDRARLLDLARESVGDARDAEERLAPVGPRTIAVRLLLNLSKIHDKRGDHARSLVVCDRLFDL